MGDVSEGVSGQIECQDKCIANSKCTGIIWSYEADFYGYCYVCIDTYFVGTVGGYGFYRKPGKSKLTYRIHTHGTNILMVILNNNLIFFHSGIGGCRDDDSWVDKNGAGCGSYFTALCTDAAQNANTDGIDATSACCVCGGGKGMIFPDSIFCSCIIKHD